MKYLTSAIAKSKFGKINSQLEFMKFIGKTTI